MGSEKILFSIRIKLATFIRNSLSILDNISLKLCMKLKYPEYCKNDVYIHPASKLGNFTMIGKGTNINGPALIASSIEAPCYIGKFCAIGNNLRIRPRNHYTGFVNMNDKFQNRYNFPDLSSFKGEVNIGNNCWIADNVIILGGVKIGDGAVIGAGSIVTKDIPAYSIAAGNPAKVIKKRFNDKVIHQLIGINWWDWADEKITRNRKFFELDLKLNSDVALQSIIVD
ncbi:CatB-related O-acetyltransferase [Coleofasciculus sp. E2-BRE-01]|uniref:CatB-related O-acetyltransferase n=1 Tax=Coleofasciculus sp. E2-BRE-01 TaxID=3069524 RepID=UPI0032F3AB35